VGQQLHRQAELQVLFLLPGIAIHSHAEHLLAVPGLRAEDNAQHQGHGAHCRVSFCKHTNNLKHI